MKWIRSVFNTGEKPAPPGWWLEYERRIREAPEKQSALDSVRFVVFDTETTGLHPQNDRILSIGAIGLQNANIWIQDRFECYLRQSYKAKESAVSIHGILPGERAHMLDEADALQQFFTYVGGAVLVGHHLEFDIAILNAALRRTGLPKLKNRTIDTSRLAVRLQPPATGIVQPGEYSLDVLCKQYHVPAGERHTAAGDAFMTAQLFLKLTARLQKRGNRTLGDLLK